MTATAEPSDTPPFPEWNETGRGAARQAARSLRGLTPEIAERLPQLLEAMVSIGSDIELRSMLSRVVETAAELADARYAALGVLNDEGTGLGQFLTYGVDEKTHRAVGRLPGRHGLIRALLEGEGPLLLDDLTSDPRFSGFPPGHPPMRTMIGVSLRVHGAGFGALYLTDKRDDLPFTENDLQMLQILATEAGIAVGNARVYEAVRQQARWMDGSAELTTSLLSGDLDNALSVVAEQARRLAGADAAVVLEPSGAGGLEIVAASAASPAGLIGTPLPAGSEVVRRLLAAEPVFTEDMAAEGWLTAVVSRRFGPAMLLPLASGEQVKGALAVLRAPRAAQFTLPERAMATQFAQQAALALVLAEAQRDREQLAVYEDRDRIARDLHDLVIQRLFATGMMLDSAQRSAGRPELEERIGKAADELDATIQEIRTAIFALQQDPVEAPAGVRTRVLRESRTASLTLGFQPSVAFHGAVDSKVAEPVTGNLLAALRETLSNAARHARATRVEVVVDASARMPDGRDAVRLAVTDDGIGLPEDRGGRESGLRNIRQRAEDLGGGTEFGPGPDGTGTTVSWQVPL
ncbi:GAF domain-containing protein [Streptomyces sodiiphilus]|uniref:GAF domain-containing protein n=1 Tax=Streptomyces sodiiphilus TaxID=226217 RepID=A0ABN2PG71_9ACTN